MKPEELLKTLNEINDDYISELEDIKKVKSKKIWESRNFRSLGTLTASLLLIVSLYASGAFRFMTAMDSNRSLKSNESISENYMDSEDYSVESYHIGYQAIDDVTLITNAKELGEFVDKVENIDVSSSEKGTTLRETLKNITDTFFEKYRMIFAYEETTSGSIELDIMGVSKEDDVMHIYTYQTNSPETFTCDMSGWLFELIFEKESLEDVTNIYLN